MSPVWACMPVTPDACWIFCSNCVISAIVFLWLNMMKRAFEQLIILLIWGPVPVLPAARLWLWERRRDVEANPASLTGRYLSGLEKIKSPKARRMAERTLRLKGASKNNLKNLSVNIPLGVLACVTGVSGSGKSTLVFDCLLEQLRHIGSAGKRTSGAALMSGALYIDKIIHVDQSPIGRTPRSNPATFTGIFNYIRDIFTQIPEAKLRGYKPGRF